MSTSAQRTARKCHVCLARNMAATGEDNEQEIRMDDVAMSHVSRKVK